jgi:hypothetical protein
MALVIQCSREGLEFLVADQVTMIGGVGVAESVPEGESPGFDKVLKLVKQRCAWTISQTETPRAVLHHDRTLPNTLVLEIGWPPRVFQSAEAALGRVSSSDEATFSITVPTPRFHRGQATREAPITYGQFVEGAPADLLSASGTSPVLRVLAKPKKK